MDAHGAAPLSPRDAEMVPLTGPLAAAVAAVARTMPALNRWFMVPLGRRGLGAWIGTPIGGYILLLRTRGRRTGLVREAPLSYLIAEGSAWVMAGFGTRTQWYRNLLAEPAVELVLPGRTIACQAEEATDPVVRARVLPRLVRAAGLPGLLVGCNPWATADERIVELLAGVPLIRLTPADAALVAGPDDPGGRAWLWRQAVVVGALVGLAGSIRGLRRRGRHMPGRAAGSAQARPVG